MTPVSVDPTKMEPATWPMSAPAREEPILDPVLQVTECAALVSYKSIMSSLNIPFIDSFVVPVTLRCGSSSNENCTYFESSGSEIGGCSVKICQCDSNVCQVMERNGSRKSNKT